MLVVAAVAIFQTAIIFMNVGAERDAVHVIDISGSQRMRTQQLAYLALSLHAGENGPSTTAGIERTIADILATRADILRRPLYVIGPVDRTGHTPLGRIVDRFIADVRAVEARPKDNAAFSLVRRDRTILVAALNDAARKRIAIADSQNDESVAALLLGLLLQIASIMGVWYGIVAPAQRRSERLLVEVAAEREEIESTFADNPDAISVYDVTGHLVRVNASRAQLLGHRSSELTGRHFSEFVEVADFAKVSAAFERALAGETVRLESALVSSKFGRVVVASTFFPRLVDDRCAGVIVISKDVKKLRAIEAQNAEQARRLADLYEIASAHDRSTEEMVGSALGLVAARLGYEFGVVAEIVEDMVSVISTYGEPRGLVVGESRPIRKSLAQFVVAAPDVFEERDAESAPWGAKVRRELDWRSVSGMRIFIGGVLYGAVGFGSRNVRSRDLSESDIAFMRLACALLGSIIERARQMRRLDLLAHTDSLTNLANRVAFSARLAELTASGARFALHYIDLDSFKKVNDGFGHAVGDAVLCVAAKRLERCARAGDVVVRLGGDEFAILQNGPVDAEGATALAQRVVDALRRPIDLGDTQHDVGASVGVALYPDHGTDPRAIVAAADVALYRAKRLGRGCVAVAENEALTTFA